MKYEKRTYFDSFGTGNFTEIETERISFDVSPEKADRFAHFWASTGCKYYETTKAFFFEKQTDARHYTQYILYKQ